MWPLYGKKTFKGGSLRLNSQRMEQVSRVDEDYQLVKSIVHFKPMGLSSGEGGVINGFIKRALF